MDPHSPNSNLASYKFLFQSKHFGNLITRRQDEQKDAKNHHENAGREWDHYLDRKSP